MKAYELVPTREYVNRNRRILQLVQAGRSYGKIAIELGITRQRVGQIVKEARQAGWVPKVVPTAQ